MSKVQPNPLKILAAKHRLLLTTVGLAGLCCTLACAKPFGPKAKRSDVTPGTVPPVDLGNASTVEKDSATTSTLSPASIVTVAMLSRSGSQVQGSLHLRATGEDLLLSGALDGLTPLARHALHVQTEGNCESSDASSAGPDFVPPKPLQGTAWLPSPGLGTLTADPAGHADVTLLVKGYALTPGHPANLLGRSLVVYEGSNDTPAGQGRRWACGVINRSP